MSFQKTEKTIQQGLFFIHLNFLFSFFFRGLGIGFISEFFFFEIIEKMYCFLKGSWKQGYFSRCDVQNQEMSR